MAGQTHDHSAATHHLRQCIENTRSCLSLQRLALHAVAITLLKTKSREIEKCYDDYTHKWFELQYTFRVVKDTLLNDIKIFMPQTLLPDLDYTIAVKLTEILLAFDLIRVPGKKYIGDFCWTPHGSVDLNETFRSFVNKKIWQDDHALKLACRYCSEKVVMDLWETGKESLRSSKYFDINESLVNYWESFVAGKEISPDKIENLIQQGIYAKCDFMVEYFWSKLDVIRRDTVFTNWCRKLNDADLSDFRCWTVVTYFFVTHATDSQLLFLVKSKWFHVLSCLVLTSRPQTKLFTFTAIQLMSAFVDDEQRKFLVEQLIRCTISRTVISYDKVLAMLVNEGSSEWRSMMRTECEYLMPNLFGDRIGRDILMAFYKDATEEDKIEFLRDMNEDIVDEVRTSRKFVEECLLVFFRSEVSVRRFKTKLALYGMTDLFQETLVVTDLYEPFYEFCDLPDEEMVELKTRFCCYEKLKDWVCFETMSKTAIDEFSSWCLLSQTESCLLRELSTKESSSSDLSSDDSSFSTDRSDSPTSSTHSQTSPLSPPTSP